MKDLKNYFKADLSKYRGMLQFMQKRWANYASVLETEVIESKLSLILDSLTFKYARQPEFLALLPDKLTANTLRVCPTIKLVNSPKP